VVMLWSDQYAGWVKCALNLFSVVSVEQVQHQIGSKKRVGYVDQMIYLRFTSSSSGICSVI
jgi:hypothetical protein